MDLNEIMVFVKVARAGSFRKAASELGMPNSTVSAKVSSLEKRLGVTLLYRTTRSLSLTQIGETYFKACLKNIEGLKAAEDEVTLSQGEPQGVLKITAPSLLASSVLPKIFESYIEKFPKVKIELLATDGVLDLIAQNIDIAIRAGKLEDSSLIAKKLGESYFSLFASPAYLKRHEKILHPKDLLKHSCIQFTPLGRDHWNFIHKTKTKVSLALPGKLVLDELYTVKELTMSGQGIALLPTFICIDDVKDKKLVCVLPDWKSDVRNVSFVYPAHKYVSPKVSSFIALATDMIKKQLDVKF